MYVCIYIYIKPENKKKRKYAFSVLYLRVLYEMEIRYKLYGGVQSSARARRGRRRPTGVLCLVSFLLPLLYRRLPRFRGFSSRFRDRGLPRPVPTFLQLDEDEAQEWHSAGVLRLYRRRHHRLAFPMEVLTFFWLSDIHSKEEIALLCIVTVLLGSAKFVSLASASNPVLLPGKKKGDTTIIHCYCSTCAVSY
jgi:hypothetical protein